MGLLRDLAVLTGILLTLSGAALATGLAELPGTETIQVPGDSNTEEPRYILETSINIQGRTADAILDTETFDYDTKKCNVLTCSELSLADNPALAFGATNVDVQITLTNEDDVKVAEVNKYIGAVELGETTTVNQKFSNIKPGNYQLKYEMTGQDVLGLSYDQVETVNVRVPETLAGGT